MARKWFQNWFNSPYYHILYHNRNDKEAEFFIDNLLSKFNPPASSRLLDIACGKGRHSVYLNEKGYDVTGIDLSFASIEYAKQFENEKLRFFVHDMRHLFYINYFDIALNLFTSFGYFETEKDHVNALKSFNKSLKPGGFLVLDYFNKEKILRNLAPEEIKTINGIEFHLHKKVENSKIVKEITFVDKGKKYAFKEEVKAYGLVDFEKLFEASGFEIEQHFGSYSLQKYDENSSDRLIFICRKK